MVGAEVTNTLLRQLPNLITVARIVLVAPAAWLLWRDAVVPALVLIAIAGLSDAIDGEIARRFNWRTRFGEMTDPAADKLLVVAVFVVLAVQGHLPLWLVVVVVLRDVVIVSGTLTYRHLFGTVEMSPTPLSKANTGLQIVAILLLLVGRTDYQPVAGFCAAAVDPAGFVLVAVFSVVSGAQYVIVWSRRAKQTAARQRETAEPGP